MYYKEKMPVLSFRFIKNNEPMWFEAYQVGEQYALTWRDVEDRGGWIAWRNNLDEVLKLIPLDAEKVV